MPQGNRYNRNVKPRIPAAVALCLSLACFAGCSHSVDNKEAVKQGIVNYLSKRSDFLAMDVSVTSVAFRQDEATADVHFQAKGNNNPGAGMNMQYVLERKGKEWVVKGRAGAAGGNPHTGMPQAPSGAMPQTSTGSGSIGAMPALPQGHPGVQGGGAPGGALPPGHPSIPSEGSSGALPPGHPSVSPDKSGPSK